MANSRSLILLLGLWENEKRRRMLRLRVKELAEQRGYNMSSLSRAADVGFSTVKRYFRNPYSIATTDTLEKIARTLRVEVGDLMELVPDEPLPPR